MLGLAKTYACMFNILGICVALRNRQQIISYPCVCKYLHERFKTPPPPPPHTQPPHTYTHTVLIIRCFNIKLNIINSRLRVLSEWNLTHALRIYVHSIYMFVNLCEYFYFNWKINLPHRTLHTRAFICFLCVLARTEFAFCQSYYTHTSTYIYMNN